jgi:dihydropteroate synthase type 2
MGAVRILGVLNVTEDSFSDGGRYLDPERAVERALELIADGAEAIDLGGAASHPGARAVAPTEEIRRLAPVVEALVGRGIAVSVDTFQPAVQRWALGRGVAYLNDVRGFADATLHPELARAACRLIVMHAVENAEARRPADPGTIVDRVLAFFAARLQAFDAAGIAHDRVILDPGMGFFLGGNPEPSLVMLRNLERLHETFALPVLVCVSRKSFLGTITGRPPGERGAATLAAELFAVRHGADYVRTHDVRALRDALSVTAALDF